MTRTWLVAILLVLVCSACGDPERDHPGAGSDASQAAVGPADPIPLEELPPAPAGRDDPVAATPPGTAAPTANEDPGPQADAAPDLEEPPLVPEFRERVESELQSSLLGNSNHAVDISVVLNRCRGNSLDEAHIINALERIQTRDIKPGLNWRFNNGATIVYENYEQFEAQLWRLHDECQSVKGLFDSDLRSRIGQLADRGNPQARYLYALWPPEHSVFAQANTLKTFDYHHRAMQYTQANLDEREWLGVLAMGKSYSENGLFTPRNQSLGRVFLLAAELCGSQNEWLRQQNREFMDRFQTQTRSTMLPGIERDAAELAELFCD